MDMSAHDATSAPYRVGFLLVDGFALFSYAAAVEPLRAANLLSGRALYDVLELPAEGAVATSSSGARIRASAHVGERVDFDLVLVVAGGDPSAYVSRRVTRWLRHLERRGVALGGISGGAVVLGRAGLLDGRRTTVHWDHRALLAEIAPRARLEHARYLVDGNRLSAAGGAASLELMRALIARDHGTAFARRVGDWFLQTDEPSPGAPQRSGLAERWGTTGAPLLAALGAMEDHLADPLSLDQLAALAGVGPRQLNRLFAARFGCGAIARYRALRLERAVELLARTALPVAEIARATGFSNPAHFSRRFREAFGTTPVAQRRQARGTADASTDSS